METSAHRCPDAGNNLGHRLGAGLGGVVNEQRREMRVEVARFGYSYFSITPVMGEKAG